MRWDEAEHDFTSLVFLNDMLRLDIPSLLTHLHEQLLWPFVHTLLLSLFFLLFGPTILNGRIFSLVMYFAFAIAAYFLGREVVEKNKYISGVLCTAFSLVTGSLYLSASEAMLEMTALFFSTLAVTFFLKSIKERRFYPLASLFTLLAFFSKTNFGIVLILSMLAYFLVKEKLRFRKMLRDRGFLALFAPIAIIIFFWVMPPDRLATFIAFLVNRPEGPDPLSFEGMSYYPVQLYMYSGILIFVYAAAFSLSFHHLKNEKVKFLVIMGLLAIGLNFFHQNKKIRYILYLYPVFFSLASFHLARFYSRIIYPRKGIAFFVILIIAMTAYSVYLFQNVRLYDDYYSVKRPLDFIKDSTMNSSRIFVLGEFNELSPGLIEWELSNKTNIKYVKASSYAVWEFEEFQRLIGKHLGVPDRISPERISDFIGKYGFDTIILIKPQNSSLFYNTEDFLVYNKWKLDYMPVVLENKKYMLAGWMLFEDIDVEITILKKI
ncbi:MAG: glycosyltransferase family 39 protein [Candidatus Aenigmarchaeota archaeon]|nr:glycosyltransferase family 39 protein [Candidatus Aenigmarchaeota archaeon]